MRCVCGSLYAPAALLRRLSREDTLSMLSVFRCADCCGHAADPAFVRNKARLRYGSCDFGSLYSALCAGRLAKQAAGRDRAHRLSQTRVFGNGCGVRRCIRTDACRHGQAFRLFCRGTGRHVQYAAARHGEKQMYQLSRYHLRPPIRSIRRRRRVKGPCSGFRTVSSNIAASSATFSASSERSRRKMRALFQNSRTNIAASFGQTGSTAAGQSQKIRRKEQGHSAFLGHFRSVGASRTGRLPQSVFSADVSTGSGAHPRLSPSP